MRRRFGSGPWRIDEEKDVDWLMGVRDAHEQPSGIDWDQIIDLVRK